LHFAIALLKLPFGKCESDEEADEAAAHVYLCRSIDSNVVCFGDQS